MTFLNAPTFLNSPYSQVTVQSLSCDLKNTPNDIISNIISNELSIVDRWLISNRIKINPNKSKFISFSYRKTTIYQPIKFGNQFINETSNTKFLGNTINKHKTYKDHADKTLFKSSKSVGVLFKLNSYLTPKILKMLYNSLILSYSIYGIESWLDDR